MTAIDEIEQTIDFEQSEFYFKLKHVVVLVGDGCCVVDVGVFSSAIELVIFILEGFLQGVWRRGLD